MTYTHRDYLCCICPPHILQKLLESGNKEIRDVALNTMLTSQMLRGERSVRALAAAGPSPDTGRRTIYDCGQNETVNNATLARTEDGPESTDATVNRAFVGLGATRDFYNSVFGRNSIDDRGSRLNAFVHYGNAYQNAFWDGQQMVFGDGDGVVFSDFTLSLDVIGHELAHGVTEYTANLDYHKQPGALNESMSDVFGSLVKQWFEDQTSTSADWLIGADLFTPNIGADALRSMKAPGTAYDNAFLGKDPQPDHMSRFANLPDNRFGDYGGVHINSGIPNKAFYLAAVEIGGNAWESPGHIWYESLKASNQFTQFQEFADTTFSKAGQLYGADSAEQQAILAAWREVGIRISGVAVSSASRRNSVKRSPKSDDSLAELQVQLTKMSEQLNRLTREVAALKSKK